MEDADIENDAKRARIEESADIVQVDDEEEHPVADGGAGGAASGGAAAAAAPIAGKRGRAKYEFADVCSKYSWGKDSAAGRQLWEESKEVHCSMCPSNRNLISAASNVTNLKIHTTSKLHQNSLAAFTAKASHSPASMYGHMLSGDAAVAAKSTQVARLRALHLLKGMSIVPKSRLSDLYEGDMMTAALKLRSAGVRIGVAGTMNLDVDRATEMMKDAIKKAVKGKYGAIVVDGATLADLLDGEVKPTAVLFASTAFPAPIALGYITNEDGTAKQAAVEIQELLDFYGITAEHTVCLMGDNVTYNDALARELNLVRMKCIPHSLQLVFRALTKAFPAWETLTVTLGGVITAGGGKGRRLYLRSLGANSTWFIGYPNRWASTDAVGASFFKRISSPIAGGAAAGGAGAVPEERFGFECIQAMLEREGSGVDEQDDDCDDKPKQRLAKAFSDAEIGANLLQVAAVQAVGADIAVLTTMASANADNIDLGVFPRIESLRSRLKLAATDAGAALNAETAAATSPIDYSAQELAKSKKLVVAMIKKGAADALLLFDKHVVPAMRYLAYRRKLDPSQRPPVFDKPLTVANITDFFGCEESEATAALVSEYMTYVAAWESLPAVRKAMKMGAFWLALETSYPTLSKIGRWYAEMPTSSVAAERMFGIMRHMEDPLRARMKGASFLAEWMARTNSWLCDALLAEAIEKF